MNVDYVNPVLNSVVNVLKTMANMDSRAEKPELKQGTVSMGVVTGIIAMEGVHSRGSLAITFTKPVILDLVKRMLREDIKEIDEQAKDLTGELSNIVLGSAKSEFEQNGLDFQLTLPEVLSGDGHTIKHQYDGKTILLPFTTEVGKFYVEMCFQ